MKADRRHELQQNELAAYLGRINRSIEPYSRIIAVVLGVVIFGSIALALYRSKVTEEKSDATLQLIQAAATQDTAVLAKVADDFPDTAAGAWSKLYEGNEYLAEGIRKLFTNRVDAEDSLDQAISAYQQAIDASEDRLLQSRANFGIARAAESLGNLDEAVAAYEACIAANESEAMTKKAQERIASLSSAETKDFLAWFSEQDFTPADPSLPPALPSGTSLPTIPDLKLPEIGDLGSGGSSEETGDGEKEEEGETGDGEKKEEKTGEGETGEGAADVGDSVEGESAEEKSAEGDAGEAAEDVEAAAEDSSATETTDDAASDQE